MAVIHRTTMKPTKGELLNHWLPKQSWYEGDAGGPEPELVNVGGFRLDDPQGEVGIEVMVVVDAGAPDPVAYLVPMGYRGAALEDVPAEALIGTSEHGVLGTRWIYDGAHDPVVTAQLRALLRGEAVAQHPNASDTPDPTVTVHGSDPDDAGHGGHGDAGDTGTTSPMGGTGTRFGSTGSCGRRRHRRVRPYTWSPAGPGRTERPHGPCSRPSRPGRSQHPTGRTCECIAPGHGRYDGDSRNRIRLPW